MAVTQQHRAVERLLIEIDMVDVTLKQGVEKTLLEKVPGVTAVRDATDHASGANPYYKSA